MLVIFLLNYLPTMFKVLKNVASLTQLQETCAFSQCFRNFREFITLQSEKGGSWNR